MCVAQRADAMLTLSTRTLTLLLLRVDITRGQSEDFMAKFVEAPPPANPNPKPNPALTLNPFPDPQDKSRITFNELFFGMMGLPSDFFSMNLTDNEDGDLAASRSVHPPRNPHPNPLPPAPNPPYPRSRSRYLPAPPSVARRRFSKPASGSSYLTSRLPPAVRRTLPLTLILMGGFDQQCV